MPPAQELENQRFSWNQNKAWGPHAGLEETSKGFFLGQEAPLHGGGCEERSPQTATAPATPTRPPPPPSTPALPPSSSPTGPSPPPPGPARPRAHPPPDAGTPRRRAGTRGCCSGTRSRSAAPGRPATHSGAERAGRFIRSPSSGCTNLRPCPHPEARPEPEVTSSSRAPALSSRGCCVFSCGDPVPALLLPGPALLTTRPISFRACSGIVRTRLHHSWGPSTRTPLPGLAPALPAARLLPDLRSSPSPPPPGPALGSHPRLLTCILLAAPH